MRRATSRPRIPGGRCKRSNLQATAQWNSLLGRIRIGGGTRSEQRIFYTALYHSLLHPNVVSDANGEYMGDDQRVHHVIASSVLELLRMGHIPIRDRASVCRRTRSDRRHDPIPSERRSTERMVPQVGDR